MPPRHNGKGGNIRRDRRASSHIGENPHTNGAPSGRSVTSNGARAAVGTMTTERTVIFAQDTAALSLETDDASTTGTAAVHTLAREPAPASRSPAPAADHASVINGTAPTRRQKRENLLESIFSIKEEQRQDSSTTSTSLPSPLLPPHTGDSPHRSDLSPSAAQMGLSLGYRLSVPITPTTSTRADLPYRVGGPPHHWSVFYPAGLEAQPPVVLHYVSVGSWRTVAGGRDYFAHRRLRRREVLGHSVWWLHNARPRDRMVLVVDPVEMVVKDSAAEGCAVRHRGGLFGKLKGRIFTNAPAFAYCRGRLAKERAPEIAEDHSGSSNAAAAEDGAMGGSRTLVEPSSWTRMTEAPTASGLPITAEKHSDGAAAAAPRVNSHHQCAEESIGRQVMRRSSSYGSYPGPVDDVAMRRRRSVSARGRRYLVDSAASSSGGGPYQSTGTRRSRLSSARPSAPGTRRGVEVVEVLHENITAMDYAPRLTSSRFSVEAKAVYTYFFPSLADALRYYGCPEALDQVRHQLAEGLTHQVAQVDRAGATVCTPLYPGRGFGPGSKVGPLGGDEWNGYRGSSCSLPRTVLFPADKPVSSSSAPSPYLQRTEEVSRDGTTAASKTLAATHQPLVSPSSVLLRGLPQLHCSEHGDHRGSGGPLTPGDRRTSSSFVDDVSGPFPSSASMTDCTAHPAPPVLISTHLNTVVSIYTADPHFTGVLREVLMPEAGIHPYTATPKEQRRMLAMYETGMPPWTVLLAASWLPYRRVFRLLYVGLVNLWPIISLAVGLYDLYKHLPQLRKFMAHTLEPLTRWVEDRFTVRVSVLVTYLISSVLTVFTSLSSFLSQFYVVQFFSLPIVTLFFDAVQLPFIVAFEVVRTTGSITYSFVSLVWMTIRVLIIGPFLLVAQVASLLSGVQSAVPAAVEGTSLTLRWWKAWQEFWLTVASPIKNLAKAWWDSLMHVLASGLRREASIRRWYAPHLATLMGLFSLAQDVIVTNVWLWMDVARTFGYARQVVLLAVVAYLYWALLVISPAVLGAELQRVWQLLGAEGLNVSDAGGGGEAAGVWSVFTARSEESGGSASFVFNEETRVVMFFTALGRDAVHVARCMWQLLLKQVSTVWKVAALGPTWLLWKQNETFGIVWRTRDM